MTNGIGIIKALVGNVVATATDGSQRVLHVGDHVFSYEIITTATNGAIEIEFFDGSILDLGRYSQVFLDNDIFPQQNVKEVSSDNDVEEFQQTLLDGVDPTQASEPTSAGSNTQSDGNEGIDIVQVAYEQQSLEEVISGFITTGIREADFVALDNEDAQNIAPIIEPTGLNLNEVSAFEDAPIITSTADDAKGIASEAGHLDDGIVVAATIATGILSSSDADNNSTVTWTGTSAGTYGNFAINSSTGAWTYTVDATTSSAADKLAEGETKTEVFTATVNNDKGTTATQVVTITIQGTNDLPVAINTTHITIEENTAITIDVLANDTDIDNGDDLNTFSLDNVSFSSGVPTVPTATISMVANKLVFNPGTDFDYLAEGETAIVVVNYTMSDDSDAASTATATITVMGSNDAPTAENDDLIKGADAGVTVTGLYAVGSNTNLLDGITEPLITTKAHFYFEHKSLGYTGYNYMGSSTDGGVNDIDNHDWFVEHGVDISLLRGGIITFSDGTQGVINVASNGITGESAYIYYHGAEEDVAITIKVLTNDFDIDNDAISVTAIQGQDVSSGQVINVVDGSENIGTAKVIVVDGEDRIEFTPKPNHSGKVSFEYTISDGDLSDNAVVNLDVTPVADAPSLLMSIGNEAATNNITNGSFEDLNVTRSWGHFDSNQINGWDSTSDIEIWDHVGRYKAADGQQNMELDYAQGIDSVSQTMDLEAGKYTLTFDAANRGTMRGTNPTNDFNVLWNGQIIAEIKGVDISGGANGVWDSFTFEVDAVEGNNTVIFIETAEGNNSLGPLLDDIKLVDSSYDSSINYSYDMIINASLTDDSESLSLVSIPVSSLNGATIQEIDGVVSLDGTNYKVTVSNGVDTTIKLLSTTQLTEVDINAIQGSISSSERVGTHIVDTETTIENVLIEVNNIDNGGNSYTGTGSASNELLQGINDGSSTNLIGDAGDDVLFASVGQDTLTGGSGHDNFTWAKESVDGVGATADLIVDFTVGDDTLDLSELLSDGSHTIAGINNGGDLQIKITKVGLGVVQSIDLQGVSAGTDAMLSLNKLLADGSIDDGI